MGPTSIERRNAIRDPMYMESSHLGLLRNPERAAETGPLRPSRTGETERAWPFFGHGNARATNDESEDPIEWRSVTLPVADPRLVV